MRQTARNLRFLLCVSVAAVITPAAQAQPATNSPTVTHSIDAKQASAAGLRRLQSRHHVLYTDVPSSLEVDGLPNLFDAAVPLWAKYFGIDPTAVSDWQVQAYLIRDREKFVALGLMPTDRELVNGYAAASEIWVLDQPSDYYRRHL